MTRDMEEGDLFAGVRMREWYGLHWCAPWCVHDHTKSQHEFYSTGAKGAE